MSELSRRHLLALSAAGILLAGCTDRTKRPATSTPSPAGTTPPSSRTATPVPATAADWKRFGGTIRGRLLQPEDPKYDQARLTENPRYDDARPIGILVAASAADVAAGLGFATAHGIPIALRSGGHSYPGWSAGGASGTRMPPSLVIDTRALSRITLNSNGAATIGAGASLADVYSTLGKHGRALAAGSCATVGVSGLTLGGGVGVLTRAYGLTCDALTSVEIVTADAVVRTASAERDEDLFWACRGGGGGHLGVVTSLTFATSNPPDVTMYSLSWPWRAAASVISAWQRWAPGADRRLWSTLKLLGGHSHPNGPGIYLSGTWIGPHGGLAAQLRPLLAAIGSPPNDNEASRHDYLDAMMRYAGCSGTPIDACHTGPGGALSRHPFAATSHMAYRTLDADAVSALIAGIEAAGRVKGLTEGGISMDALGGKVADIAPDATAFVHRKALMSVQYTATFATGADPAPFDRYVRGIRSAMTRYWGNGAYVNYADQSLTNARAAYFGANADRLADVAHKYDPQHLFTQPQPY